MQLERLRKPGSTGTAVWLGLALALVLGVWIAFGPTAPASADTSPENCQANNLSLDIQRELGPGQQGPANASIVSPGQEVLYRVSVANENDEGCDVLDATITLYLPGADGQPDLGNPIDLTPFSAVLDAPDFNDDTTLADFRIDTGNPAGPHPGDTEYPQQSYIVNLDPGVTSIVARADVSAPTGLQDTPDGQPGDLVEISKTVSSTVASPEINVVKTPDGAEIEAGDTASFTIAVTADGLGTLSDVVLSDTLPTLPGGGTWTENPDAAECDIVGNVLTCDLGDVQDPDLDNDGSVIFTVTVEAPTVSPDDCGTVLNNLAVVSGSNFDSVEDPGDITINCPEITIEKIPDGGEVVAPGTASFTIVVTNLGPGTASDVIIDDVLPSVPSGGDWTENPDLAECDITGGNTLHCDVGNLADGESFEVTVEVPVVDPLDCDEVLLNTATANANNDGEVSDDGDITILCEVPQLTIEKSPDGGTIEPGDTASFTIVVTNLGPGTAFNTVLQDSLPGGYTWVEDPDNADCDITGGTELECQIGDMAPDDTFTVTVSAETDPDVAECFLENVAVAFADNHSEVSDPGDIECSSTKVSSVTTFLGGDSTSGGAPWGAAATGVGLIGLIAGSAYVLRRRTPQEVAVN